MQQSSNIGRTQLHVQRRPTGPRPKRPKVPGAAASSRILYHSQSAANATDINQQNHQNHQNHPRPLPQRPTHLSSWFQPIQSTGSARNRGEVHNIPFSSRTSKLEHVHELAHDPIKDIFGAQDGIAWDAPVWKNCMEEAKHRDENIIGNWNQNMDVILIFAGLFSAILTAFLIEFYKLLQPNPQKIAADQLVLIRELLQSALPHQNSTKSPVSITSANLSFQPTGSVIAVNILWFTSLTCSLGAAMGAMVIKQWLQQYTMGMSPNAFEYTHQHQHRYHALLAWHVPSIISSLPLIMLVSVGFFLVGLGLQLIQVHIGVASVIIGFMGVVLICYWLSMILSLIYPACPYKTTAMVLLKSIVRDAKSLLGRLQSTGKSAKLYSHVYDNDVEINEIKCQQPQLLVNSITWLLAVSQQEEAIHNALLAVNQFNYTEDMVQRLLACNAMEKLVQRASVPLPPLGHAFWKHVNEISSSHPMFLELSTARKYMQTLIAIWHHPSYLNEEKPPAISQYNDLERKKVQKDNCWCLLGNWLLFWKLLKQQNGKLLDLARKGYDLNMYANVICAEVCYNHLQRANTPVYFPQCNEAFIDLYEMLEVIKSEGQGKLGLEENSFLLLLDTLAYVHCETTSESEHQQLLGSSGTPGSSQHQLLNLPSLKKQEIILLLVQLLEKNGMRYNLVSKKLLLCLQMLLPVPVVTFSKRVFFVHCQTDNPSEGRLFEQMNMTLEGLLNIFISRRSSQNQLHKEGPEIRDTIASLTLRQLVCSNLKAEGLCVYDDSILLHLPSACVDDLLDYFINDYDSLWKGHLQLCWLYELLTKLYNKGSLSVHNVERCVNMLQNTLISEWPDFELQGLLKRTLDFFNILWKTPSFRNLICITLYNILTLSTTVGMQGRKFVVSYIEKEILDAVRGFLKSEGCSEDCRSKWQNLNEDWEKP